MVLGRESLGRSDTFAVEGGGAARVEKAGEGKVVGGVRGRGRRLGLEDSEDARAELGPLGPGAGMGTGGSGRTRACGELLVEEDGVVV